MNTPECSRLLKPSDVAFFLNISRSLSYQLLQTGQIPSIRIGTAVRVREQDLEDYIRKHRCLGAHDLSQEGGD